jgi:hypothetical protein
MAKKKKKLARPAKGNYIKVQAKFPIPLVDAIEDMKGYVSMNEFLKDAAARKIGHWPF